MCDYRQKTVDHVLSRRTENNRNIHSLCKRLNVEINNEEALSALRTVRRYKVSNEGIKLLKVVSTNLRFSFHPSASLIVANIHGRMSLAFLNRNCKFFHPVAKIVDDQLLLKIHISPLSILKELFNFYKIELESINSFFFCNNKCRISLIDPKKQVSKFETLKSSQPFLCRLLDVCDNTFSMK